MKNKIPQVELRFLQAGKLHGFRGESSAQTFRKDLPALSVRYHSVLQSSPGKLLPLYVVTRDHDPASGRLTLFFGGNTANEALEDIDMPAGVYARMVLRPKYGLFWGKAIEEAKRWFYGEWLPQSKFSPLNLEFEHHTDRTTGKQPTLELFFALRKKEEA